MPTPSAPPPPYFRKPKEPTPISGIEAACNVACVFYSFLAVVARDNISHDGRAEALVLADCMKACNDKFGSK